MTSVSMNHKATWGLWARVPSVVGPKLKLLPKLVCVLVAYPGIHVIRYPVK